MMLVALIYLLLCMPVTVRASVGLSDAQNAVQTSVFALGVGMRFDGVIEKRADGLALHLTPRYGERKRKRHERMRSLSSLKKAKPFLVAAMNEVEFTRLDLHMRLGMEEAWSTAVTAGAIRAAAASLLSCLQNVPPCDLRVEADFRAPCFLLTAHCIFSAMPGDIMFAVIKTAVKKTRKEGFKWISIPSRA